MITSGGGGASSESNQPDWLQLPDELLHYILRRFSKLKHFRSFQAVCKQWRQAAAMFTQGISDQPHNGTFRQSLPWLMQWCDDFRHIYVPSDDPIEYEHIGSSFGWLLRATKKQQHSLFLFNPLTGNRIPLPATSELGRHRVSGFAMSAEPTTTKPEGCMVMIYYVITENNSFRWGLACCEIGDQRWRFSLSVGRIRIMSIVFWKGKFYGVNCDGYILVCDAYGVSWVFRPRIDMILSSRARFWFHDLHYLLVSPDDGELVMVVRSCTSARHAFKVYKINVDCKTMDEIASIGDYALFLDSDKAIYVSVKDHTEYKRNCIYHPRGVFDIDMQRNNSVSYFNVDGRWDFSDFWIVPTDY